MCSSSRTPSQQDTTGTCQPVELQSVNSSLAETALGHHGAVTCTFPQWHTDVYTRRLRAHQSRRGVRRRRTAGWVATSRQSEELAQTRSRSRPRSSSSTCSATTACLNVLHKGQKLLSYLFQNFRRPLELNAMLQHMPAATGETANSCLGAHGVCQPPPRRRGSKRYIDVGCYRARVRERGMVGHAPRKCSTRSRRCTRTLPARCTPAHGAAQAVKRRSVTASACT